MRFFILLSLASSLLFSEMLERTQMLMGTFVTVSLPKEKSKEQQKSFEILRSLERSLSSYGPQADIYRLNHERSSMISPYTYEALLLSKRYY
ncbi:MAG: FAD:protein FMN transferase, partial [Sulfurimonadaceae bacterium]